MMTKQALLRSASPALRFVLMMGVVNLFTDATFEAGAAINGPFLGTLGAGAAAISIIAGAGEFLGYALRVLAGYVADKTGKVWIVAFIGYALNQLAVPAMALTGDWRIAGALILLERTGRAIRKPTVDTMLSYTTTRLGSGWAYGVNTALDEAGATIGPLLMALVLLLHGSYRTCYAVLIGSALLSLVSLTAARVAFPVPADLAEGRPAPAKGFTPSFWCCMAAGACFAAGMMSFELISFHLAKTGVISGYWIALFLAIPTAFGAVANLSLGRVYDRFGLPVVIAAVVLSSLFSPLVFLGGFWMALGGMLLWAIGYATQDTLLKAVVAGTLPEGRRNFAFGLFYVGYGGGWLIGSVVTGLLYEHSRAGLIAFAIAAQLASLPFFVLAAKSGGMQRRPSTPPDQSAGESA